MLFLNISRREGIKLSSNGEFPVKCRSSNYFDHVSNDLTSFPRARSIFTFCDVVHYARNRIQLDTGAFEFLSLFRYRLPVRSIFQASLEEHGESYRDFDFPFGRRWLSFRVSLSYRWKSFVGNLFLISHFVS